MGIRIGIKLGENVEDSVVTVSGYEVYPIDDEMAQEFCGLKRQYVSSDNKNDGPGGDLWSWLANYTGRHPNEFFMSDPVLKSDMPDPKRDEWMVFKDRGKQGVRIERVPVAARVFSATGEPNAVVTREYPNPPEAQTNSTGSVTLSKGVAEESSRTREKNWSIGTEQSIGVEVEGGLEGVAKGKISRSMSFSASKGGSDSRTQSHSVTREIADTANYDVPPGRVHEKSLVVGDGSIEIDIDYEYRIKGHATAWYKKPLGHLGDGAAFDFDIHEWCRDKGRPTVLKTTERLKIGIVSDGKVETAVRDFTAADRT